MTLRTGRAKNLAVAFMIAALAVASWFKPLDETASEVIDTGMKGAFIAFASARAINGLISVIQSGQVGVQAGAGMSANPGEALDPINDLIEQFSDVMLAATVAFGVQKVLLAIGGHYVLPALLSLSAALWIAMTFSSRAPPRLLGQLVIVLVVVRFAVPIAAIGTDILTNAFLAPTQVEAQQSLSQFAGKSAASAETATTDEPKEGWLDKAKRLYRSATDGAGQIERLAAAAERMAKDVTNLIVVFLLQTLVFPLALMWLLYQAALSLLRPAPAAQG